MAARPHGVQTGTPTACAVDIGAGPIIAPWQQPHASQAAWLALAYLLEYRHWPVKTLVWSASVLFAAVNISIARCLAHTATTKCT